MTISPGRPLIVFFLSSFRGFNTGVGGHYRSIFEVSRMLSTEFDVRVVTFGDIPSPVYSERSDYTHVEASSPLHPGALRRLRNLLTQFQAQRGTEPLRIVSTGLNNDYAPMRLASIGMGASYFHVKPGGKAATAPSVFNGIPMAVFHDDDLRCFQHADPNRMVVMTPGRVTPPPYDANYLALARSPVFESNRVNIACIMRLSDYYRDSIAAIHQALAPIHGATFTHYGTIQDQAVHDQFVGSSLTVPYALVTDPAVTSAAAKAIHPFQAFIGFGRSALEAMALGLPVFIPAHGPKGPRLLGVTRSNWAVFARSNFTARVNYEEVLQTGDVIDLVDATVDPRKLSRLGDDSRWVFDQNYSVASSKNTWMELLANASFKGGARDAIRFGLLFRSEAKRLAILRSAARAQQAQQAHSDRK